MHQIKREQSESGQVGLLPAQQHVNQCCSEITHCQTVPGEPGCTSSLALVQDAPGDLAVRGAVALG